MPLKTAHRSLTSSAHNTCSISWVRVCICICKLSKLFSLNYCPMCVGMWQRCQWYWWLYPLDQHCTLACPRARANSAYEDFLNAEILSYTRSQAICQMGWEVTSRQCWKTHAHCGRSDVHRRLDQLTFCRPAHSIDIFIRQCDIINHLWKDL